MLLFPWSSMVILSFFCFIYRLYMEIMHICHDMWPCERYGNITQGIYSPHYQRLFSLQLKLLLSIHNGICRADFQRLVKIEQLGYSIKNRCNVNGKPNIRAWYYWLLLCGLCINTNALVEVTQIPPAMLIHDKNVAEPP